MEMSWFGWLAVVVLCIHFLINFFIAKREYDDWRKFYHKEKIWPTLIMLFFLGDIAWIIGMAVAATVFAAAMLLGPKGES